jgi:imidazolonepropionase-like amidohydrolase
MSEGPGDRGTLSVRADGAWLGPGRRAQDVKVVCDGDLISWVGPSSKAPSADRAIDLQGFLMPAVADRHAHIAMTDSGAVLASGISAVRDLGWPTEEILSLAEASEGPAFNGPLIRASGSMITSVGGYPSRAPWAPNGTARPVRDADEAAAAVSDLVAAGASQISLVMDSLAGPPLSDIAVAAVCQAAHESGLQISCRASGSGEAERALGAGVDELASVPWTDVIPDRVLAAMARAMRWVSVLGPLAGPGRKRELSTAMDNASRFVAAGGTLVYGTDLGKEDDVGVSVEELRLMDSAGLGPDALLDGLARAPIEPGAPADLLGLAEDPATDLAALGSPLLVVRGGRVVVPTRA